MISIELKDVRFQAHHGVYKDESKTGNTYHIDLSVKFDEEDIRFETLKNTIDYVALYDIVKQRMQSSTHLIEQLCESIIGQVKLQYPFVKETTISIYKIQAPIENFEGRVGVTLCKKFND
jgi:7,8-dihydroneopterin aldolase/epimerase/oxygenase